ncbi:MAG: redoxin domain-containing protein [Deltaproteobacteria bacterium]|nr:redoxin domain-containing protein [Deltaproteobacteria bacterium]
METGIKWIGVLAFSIWGWGSALAAPERTATANVASENAGTATDRVMGLLDEAEALLEQRDHRASLKLFKKAADLGGLQCFDCQLGLARVYRRLGAHKDSLEHARNALVVGDSSGRLVVAHSEAGLALMAGGDSASLAEAAKHFRQAAEVSQGQVPILFFNLGVVLLKLSRDEEGVVALERFVELEPEGSQVDQARAFIDKPRRAREDLIPPFSAATLDGRLISDQDLEGKVVLFDFWATWCAPCRASLPQLRRLNRAFEDSPFVLLGVSSDREKQTLLDFIEEEAMVWPQVHDDRGAVSKRAFKVTSFPTYILVDHEGRIVFRRSGWSPSIEREVTARVKQAVKKLKKQQKAKS